MATDGQATQTATNLMHVLHSLKGPPLWSQPGVRGPLRLTCKDAATLGAEATTRTRLSLQPDDRGRCQGMLRRHPHLTSITIVGNTTKRHLMFHSSVVGRNDVLRPWRKALPAAPLLPRFLHDCASGLMTVTNLDLRGVTGLSPGCATALSLLLPNLTALSLRWDCTLETERVPPASAGPVGTRPHLAGFFLLLQHLARLTELRLYCMQPSQGDLDDVALLTRLKVLWLTPTPLGSHLSQLISLTSLHTLAIYARAGDIADETLHLAARLPHLTSFYFDQPLDDLSHWRALQGCTRLYSLEIHELPFQLLVPHKSAPIVMPPSVRALEITQPPSVKALSAFLAAVTLPGLRELGAEVWVDPDSDIKAGLVGLLALLPLVEVVRVYFTGHVAVSDCAAGAMREALLLHPRLRDVTGPRPPPNIPYDLYEQESVDSAGDDDMSSSGGEEETSGSEEGGDGKDE